MQVGEAVWCEVNSFFDIREVKIEKETSDFFISVYPKKRSPFAERKIDCTNKRRIN